MAQDVSSRSVLYSGVSTQDAYASVRGCSIITLASYVWARFMDGFLASALFPAIPALQKDLHINDNEITWEFSGTVTEIFRPQGTLTPIFVQRSPPHSPDSC